MPKGRRAAFALLPWLLCAAAGVAQSAASDVSERPAAERSILRFTVRPRSPTLLPSVPGDGPFRERHAALSPHFAQEGLFLLSDGYRAPDAETVRRMLAAVPSLADLRARDERTGKEVLLFDRARVLGEPAVRDGASRFVLETADREFGTSRYDVAVTVFEGRTELTMVNLDPLRYLILPAARPGKALLDLIYFPRGEEAAVYLVWSVRAVLFVPGFIDIEKPLRHRILAIKDWYVRQLGSGGP